MKEIIEIVQHWHQLENELGISWYDRNHHRHNAIIAKMKTYVMHDHLSFKFVSRERPWADEEMASYASSFIFNKVRPLCKISRYVTGEDRILFFCYAATKPLFDEAPEYQECYVWELIEGQAGIIAEYGWPYGQADEKVWYYVSGDETISLESLGTPTEILRLIPPEGEPASMKDYLKDK